MKSRDCYEAVAGLDGAMKECLDLDQRYYVLGGIATSAIKHQDTGFDLLASTITPTHEAAEPVLRDNQTVRDVDIFIDSVLVDEQKEDIRESVGETTDLVVSVFGLDKRVETVSKISRTLSDWTSRRTVDENRAIRYELFPLEQEVEPASFDPWTLNLPEGSAVQVFSPPAHMLAYKMRSISGTRYKDKEKLDRMTDKVMEVPEFKEQIEYGIYKEWLEFADGIQRALDGEVFLDDTILAGGTTKKDLAIFKFKGKALDKFESSEAIIKLAQTSLGEKILRPFARN